MAIPYELIAASKPFRIIVGPNKKEFTMHTELLAIMSNTLQELVSDNMKEAEEGVAEWPEVDEETFIRFWEFAYTGNYRAAEPTIDAPAPSGSTNNSNTDSNINTPKYRMWNRFLARFGTEKNGLPLRQLSLDSSASYSEVFLSHARLYVLADHYCIYELMQLCIRKLHNVLKVFNLHGKEMVLKIVQLIEYSYKNVEDPCLTDELRSMLAAYAACKIEELWGNNYFQTVLETDSDIWKDIMGELMKGLQK